MEMNAHALRQPDPGERAERGSTWERLGEITAPALVLVGTLDVQDVRAVDEMLPARLGDAGFVMARRGCPCPASRRAPARPST